MSDPPLSPPEPAAPTLGYARPDVSPAPHGLAVLAGLSGFGVVVGGVFCLLFAAYANRWSPVQFICAAAVLGGIPVLSGVWLCRSKRWRLVGSALLIGIGVAALVEGVCFLGNFR